MQSFTVTEKRRFLKGLIGHGGAVERLEKRPSPLQSLQNGSTPERLNNWEESELDAAINAHIRATAARLTDPTYLEQASDN